MSFASPDRRGGSVPAGRRQQGRRFWLLSLLLLLASMAGARAAAEDAAATASADGGAEQDFLTQLLRQGLPATYGELLTEMVSISADAAAVGAKSGHRAFGKGYFVGPPTEAGSAAMREHAVRQSLKNVLDLFNDLNFVLSTGGQLYVGNYDDAAMSTIVFILGKLANRVPAETYQYVGLSGTAVPAAALAAVQIWWESHKALRDATRAAQLEQFYGRVENLTRNLQRGPEDDPFPPTRENVERLHQELLASASLRELFSVYVRDQLNRSVRPEWFEAASLDPAQREADPQGMRDLHSHLAGLLSWLNRAAIERQQRTRSRVALERLINELRVGDMTNAEVIDRIETAIAMLGVVELYVERAPERIQTALEEGDLRTLQVQQRLIAGYVADVIAWVPSFGEEGELRDELLGQLRELYAQVESGLGEVLAEIRARLAEASARRRERPHGPAVGVESLLPEQAPPADVESLADRMLQAVLLPMIPRFDWGGVGDLEPLRARYQRLLEEGQFRRRGKSSHAQMPAGRRDLAGEFEAAWAVQDYATALEGGTASEPPREQTLDGHYQRIERALQGVPIDELASEHAGLQQQYDALLSRRRALEAQPQTASVRAQLESLLAESGVIAERIRTLMAARSQAILAARDFLALQRQLDLFELQRAESWKAQVRSLHEARAQRAADALEVYRLDLQELAGFRLHANLSQAAGVWTSPGSGETLLDVVRAQQRRVAAAAQPGLATVSEPPAHTSVSRHLETVSEAFDPGRLISNQATIALREVAGASSQLRGLAEEVRRIANGVESAQLRVRPHIEDIRTYVAPDFLVDNALRENAGRLDGLVDSWLRQAADWDRRRADQERSWRGIQRALLRMAERWLEVTRYGAEQGLMPAALERPNHPWSPQIGLGDAAVATVGEQRALLLQRPYRRLFSDAELARVDARLQALWQGSGLAQFGREQAPWLLQTFEQWQQELLAQPRVEAENFITVGRDGLVAVTAARLSAAESLLAGVRPGAPEGEDLGQRMSALVGGAVHTQDQDGVTASSLHERWQALMDRYFAWRRQHQAARDAEREAERQRQEAERQRQEAERQRREAERPADITQEQVRALYEAFVRAYGRGDTRALLNLLAPDWRGGDGADRRDVEALLGQSFRVFDRIQYRIARMSLQPEAGGGMRVSYRVQIIGENRRQRLEHTEEADIIEIVALVDGEPRILRTLSGRQWLR